MDSIVPEVILNSVALVLTISMRVFVCVSVRLCMFECVYSRPSVEVTHVIATSHWCTEPSLFRDGGVAQMVTCVLISMLGDFGTVGRGFESHRKYHISQYFLMLASAITNLDHLQTRLCNVKNC